MTVPKLKAELEARSIDIPGKMLKADLVKMLQDNDATATTSNTSTDTTNIDINVKSEPISNPIDPPHSSSSSSSSSNLSSSTGPKLSLLVDEDEEEEEEDEELPLVSSTTKTIVNTNIEGGDKKEMPSKRTTAAATTGDDRDEIAATIDEKESKDANAEKHQIAGTKSDIEEGTKIVDDMFVDNDAEDDDDSLDEEDDGVKVVIGSRTREKNTKRKSFARGRMNFNESINLNE